MENLEISKVVQFIETNWLKLETIINRLVSCKCEGYDYKHVAHRGIFVEWIVSLLVGMCNILS
jgi:hypothetical protein